VLKSAHEALGEEFTELTVGNDLGCSRRSQAQNEIYVASLLVNHILEEDLDDSDELLLRHHARLLDVV